MRGVAAGGSGGGAADAEAVARVARRGDTEARKQGANRSNEVRLREGRRGSGHEEGRGRRKGVGQEEAAEEGDRAGTARAGKADEEGDAGAEWVGLGTGEGQGQPGGGQEGGVEGNRAPREVEGRVKRGEGISELAGAEETKVAQSACGSENQRRQGRKVEEVSETAEDIIREWESGKTAGAVAVNPTSAAAHALKEETAVGGGGKTMVGVERVNGGQVLLNGRVLDALGNGSDPLAESKLSSGERRASRGIEKARTGGVAKRQELALRGRIGRTCGFAESVEKEESHIARKVPVGRVPGGVGLGEAVGWSAWNCERSKRERASARGFEWEGIQVERRRK